MREILRIKAVRFASEGEYSTCSEVGATVVEYLLALGLIVGGIAAAAMPALNAGLDNQYEAGKSSFDLADSGPLIQVP